MYAHMITAQKRTIISTRFLYFTRHGEYGIFFLNKPSYTMTKQSQYNFKNQ
jgi:hypothetical protein